MSEATYGITPFGSMIVNADDSISFTITPNPGIGGVLYYYDIHRTQWWFGVIFRKIQLLSNGKQYTMLTLLKSPFKSYLRCPVWVR